MRDELEDLLNLFDEKSKEQKTENQLMKKQLKEERESFNASFNDLMSFTIRPAMINLLVKIKAHGHITDIAEKKPSYGPYISESYTVVRFPGAGQLSISIVGNYDHKKVFIYTEYEKDNAKKKIENAYDLTEVTETLLNSVVTEGMSKILRVD